MSTGLTTLRDFRSFVALCDKLARQGRRDVFEALQDGRLLVDDLRRADDLDGLATVTAEVALFKRVWDWRDDAGKRHKGALNEALAKVSSPHSRKRYGVSLKKLASLTIGGKPVIPANALLRDLTAVPWDTLASAWPDSGSDWNHLKRAISALLTILFGGKRKGRYHPFRLDVLDRMPTMEEHERVPDISVEAWHDALSQMPEHARPGIWFLTLTAKRLGEYERVQPDNLLRHTHRVYIPPVPGKRTKTAHQYVAVDPEMWDWIEAAVPMPIKRGWLRKYWRRACLKTGLARMVPDLKRIDPETKKPKRKYQGPTLHDLRHCAAQWAANAGVSMPVIQSQLAHKNPKTTSRYTAQVMTAEHASVMANLLKIPLGNKLGNSAEVSGAVRDEARQIANANVLSRKVEG